MSNNQIIQIALLDDNPMFLSGIKSLLSDHPAFHIIAEANSIHSLKKNTDSEPDIIVLLQHTDVDDAVNISEKVSSNFPNAKLAMFISDTNHLNIHKLMQNNVFGYFSQKMNVDSLVFALKTVHQNKYWLNIDTMQIVVSQYKHLHNKDDQIKHMLTTTTPPRHLITNREYEILQYLAKGHKSEEIADFLKINDSTVKSHIANMFRKNKVNTRTDLIIKAIKNNWLHVSDEEDDNTEIKSSS